MKATAPLKKFPYMKEWIAQADLLKEANMVKKNEQLAATPLLK